MSTDKRPAPTVYQRWPESNSTVSKQIGGAPLPPVESMSVPPVKPGSIKPNERKWP